MGRKTGMTETEARTKYGNEIVNRLLSENCDFTGRLDDVLDLDNEYEFSACVEIDNDDYDMLTIYYYEDKTDVQNCDGDLGCLNWNDFVIVEE